jgi:hypothetical protein
MADFTGTTFTGDDLSGSRFERVVQAGAEFRAVDLSHARFRGVDLGGVVVRGVELVDVCDGEIRKLVVNGVDVAPLAAHTEPVEGPGWPPPQSFQVRECLLIVLNEEWHHRQFAERDLGALQTDGS